MCEEIIAVFSKNRTKPKCTLWAECGLLERKTS